MAVGVASPPLVTPSRSFQSFSRTLSQPETSVPEISRCHESSTSSSSSPSTSGSTINSSSVVTPTTPTTPYQRPSTLHGLKHKLHTAAKTLHSPGRRKSVGHIPLSPLARTPSPSPLPSSPTRSPSPLAFPPGHQPGSSNTTQSYSPGSSSAPKKGFGRAKSAEPGSPLLRRALSPDRLHPRTAEKPGPASISPLCDPALKVTISTPRLTITSKSPHLMKSAAVEEEKDNIKPKLPVKSSLSLQDNDRNSKKEEDFVIGGSQPLPRIAEEKDSPTALKEEQLTMGSVKLETGAYLKGTITQMTVSPQISVGNQVQVPVSASPSWSSGCKMTCSSTVYVTPHVTHTLREPPPIPQKPKSKSSTIKNICTGKKWKKEQKLTKEEDSDSKQPLSSSSGYKMSGRK